MKKLVKDWKSLNNQNDPNMGALYDKYRKAGVTPLEFGVNGVVAALATFGIVIVGIIGGNLIQALPLDYATKLLAYVVGIFYWAKLVKKVVDYLDRVDPYDRRMRRKKFLKTGSYRIEVIEGKPKIVDEAGNVIEA